MKRYSTSCASAEQRAKPDIHEDEEQRFTVLGEIEDGCNYQPTISVVITAHFVDGGSDNYVYTVRVSEY